MTTILALDLGAKCGYACGTAAKENRKILTGTFAPKIDRFAGGGVRFVKFVEFLSQLHETLGFDRVFFEKVRGHKGVDAAHAYGGYLSHLQVFCEDRGIPYEGVGVGEIKKYATGKGNASKAEVIAAVQSWGFDKVADDNEADAIAVFRYAVEHGA